MDLLAATMALAAEGSAIWTWIWRSLAKGQLVEVFPFSLFSMPCVVL